MSNSHATTRPRRYWELTVGLPLFNAVVVTLAYAFFRSVVGLPGPDVIADSASGLLMFMAYAAASSLAGYLPAHLILARAVDNDVANPGATGPASIAFTDLYSSTRATDLPALVMTLALVIVVVALTAALVLPDGDAVNEDFRIVLILALVPLMTLYPAIIHRLRIGPDAMGRARPEDDG